MKTQNTEEMVQGAVVDIERFAPKNSHVEIDVREDPVGNFSTHIFLQTKQRTYFAKKDDMVLSKSFQKAVKAMKSQLQKRHTKHSEIQIDNYHQAI